MLKTYKTFNPMIRLYEFNNKLLGNVTLFRVISGIIWTQLIRDSFEV